ncbi:MAG: tetratricopeptide repeat protein [Nitrospiraceae bacterium]
MKLSALYSLSRDWLLTGTMMMALVGLIIGILNILERERPASARAVELSYLPKGEYLKVAVLGYRQMVADLLWLKVVQHFGVREQTTEGFLWAYKAADTLTDLDPKFAYAYQATGTVLAVSAKQIQESVALLKKAMHHNPDAWIFPFLLGYDYYFELHDPATAGKYFRIASMLPGSPTYLPHLASKMTVVAGDAEAALEFLQRLYQQVQDERIREGLAQRMKEVVVERDIRFLDEAVRRYRGIYGNFPSRLEELVKGGVILAVPNEPLGGSYRLSPGDGRITSTGLPERVHLYK